MKGLPIIAFISFSIWVGPVLAQGLMVYPAKGQSQEQMEKDKFSCYTWAKQQTGFDPMAAAQATQQPPPPSSQGSALRGAGKGAAAGAVGGAIAGSAGKGAAIGAGAGALLGGARQRSGAQTQQRLKEQQSAELARRRADYDRAYAACLEGKGYTVK